MIYLDNGATSFPKPREVVCAMVDAMVSCANPGRGGYPASMAAAQRVYSCRERAAHLFGCKPEQVVFTSGCTHGLNIAIRSLFSKGDRVAISGFEHNAVTRPLHLLGIEGKIAGRRLFDPADTLQRWEDALRAGVDGAVFTHVSNVFGYILPVQEMAALCKAYGVPFIIDAAQSAGVLDVSLDRLQADFIAMPGHKGLLGPMGTGILLCAREGSPLMAGGTGSESENQQMPDYLPDRLEPGTANVPGIAGLEAGIRKVQQLGREQIHRRECSAAKQCIRMLERKGYTVFSGEDQTGVVSFLPKGDCETFAQALAQRNIAVRAGLHCAPLAHESAGTLETGTVRLSFGPDAAPMQVNLLRQAIESIEKTAGK